MSKLYNFSDIEFSEIVKQSYSYKELGRKLGYNCNSSDLTNMLKNRIEKLQLDVSHFSTKGKGKIERSEENVFIENSTADQSTLRRWYKQGEYTPYICSICGQEPIWQNKELTLILDHINGNNKDDRLENLRWVCPNCNQQLPTTGSRNIKHKKISFYCIDCGKEISKGSLRCTKCASKKKIVPLEDMLITREELKELIRTTPFTKIGEMYQVSDNSIRKWCDKFNLPRKVSDIKKYTDEEWLNI